MALKCLTCGLLFRNGNELDWHVRQEHQKQPLSPAEVPPGRPAATPATIPSHGGCLAPYSVRWSSRLSWRPRAPPTARAGSRWGAEH